MLLFTDGDILFLDTQHALQELKIDSIFNINSADYLDLLIIKSKEHFLFSIEPQRIEFHNAKNFNCTDSWDYFLPRALVGADKNKDGSSIAVWDTANTLTLFNFLKQLEIVPRLQ